MITNINLKISSNKNFLYIHNNSHKEHVRVHIIHCEEVNN